MKDGEFMMRNEKAVEKMNKTVKILLIFKEMFVYLLTIFI